MILWWLIMPIVRTVGRLFGVLTDRHDGLPTGAGAFVEGFLLTLTVGVCGVGLTMLVLS